MTGYRNKVQSPWTPNESCLQEKMSIFLKYSGLQIVQDTVPGG